MENVKELSCIFDELRKKYNNFVDYYNDNGMEKLIEEVKKILNLHDKVFEIATALGNTGFIISLLDLPDNLSGAVACDDSYKEKYGSKRLIQINKNESIKHQRFTMAHELAHYIFDYDGTSKYYSEYNLLPEKQMDKREKRANRFAAALLMPSNDFIHSYKSLEDSGFDRNLILELLSNEFYVSRKAVLLRKEELNI